MTAAASEARTFVSPQTVDRWRLYALLDALEGDLRDALREWVLPFKNIDEILGTVLRLCDPNFCALRRVSSNFERA
jgi:hypothetical protein